MPTSTSITILSTIKPPLRWEPERGEFTEEFLRSKSKDPNGPSYDDLVTGDDSVLAEAQRILGRCLPPNELEGQETGLVVGYVQSGKTMSIATVISLARDNDYGMVIVFAGTKTNLQDQSERRLTIDLGIKEGDNWYHFSNPHTADASKIEDKLQAWKKKPKTKKAMLITVLKERTHLKNLDKVLRRLSLAHVPVLLIDDESDQASLNTKAAKIRTGKADPGARSSIYDHILTIRASVPHHSFLQYTATPQANLLLAQTDLLNPSFAELLTPGRAYVGGREFFKENPGLIVNIPICEVPSKHNVISSKPKSLLSALRYFLLVCAQHALTKVKGTDRNRSMMVHPAMQTDRHKVYKDWVDKSLKTLTSYLEIQYQRSKNDIIGVFQAEYDSLKKTYTQLRPLADLIESMVNDVLDEINCVEVNGTPDAEKEIEWTKTSYWILVGGAKLDRGYTVEGLAVTYMPRPLSSSPAADTLQQRARFFGYKRSYLGLCRVFVQREVCEAFSNYVDHEEFVRSALIKNRGKPLREWRRDFLLDQLLNPTRPNVIGLNARRINFRDWMVPQALHLEGAAVSANRTLLDRVDQEWRMTYGPACNPSDIPRFKGSKMPTPILQGIPLKAVFEDFMMRLEIRDQNDAEDHSAILIAMTELLREYPELAVDVFLMNNLVPQYRARAAGRGYPAGHINAPINQYFSNSSDTVNDRSFFSPSRISLQLRRFNLGSKARDPGSADIFSVTWFALKIPASFSANLHIEDRE